MLGVVLVFQDDINGRLEGPLVSDPVVPAAAQDARQEQSTGPSRITAAGSTPAPLEREAPGQAVDAAVASLIPPMPDFSEPGDPPRLAAADGPVAATQQDALDAVMRDALAAADDGERSPESAPAATETAPTAAVPPSVSATASGTG